MVWSRGPTAQRRTCPAKNTIVQDDLANPGQCLVDVTGDNRIAEFDDWLEGALRIKLHSRRPPRGFPQLPRYRRFQRSRQAVLRLLHRHQDRHSPVRLRYALQVLRQIELKLERELRLAVRTPPNYVPKIIRPPVYRRVQAGAHHVADEEQHIEQRTLPTAVRAHEDVESVQCHVNATQATKVDCSYAAQRGTHRVSAPVVRAATGQRGLAASPRTA